MRKTVWLSEKKLSNNTMFVFEAPYVFFDKYSRKWRQDLRYFNDAEIARLELRKNGFRIK